MPSLFHKKSKSSLVIRRILAESDDEDLQQRVRAMSTSSTSSQCSSSGSTKSTSYNPLSLHPPLCLNTSPVDSDEEDTQQAQENTNYDSQNTDDDTAEEVKVHYTKSSRRRTHVYGQQVQWPLKDFQAIPKGLTDMSEGDFEAYSTPHAAPSTTHQRRPSRDEGSSDMESFVKRGSWKRRGIVFELDSNSEREQTQHFEFPMPI
jgi:hypothetical protein